MSEQVNMILSSPATHALPVPVIDNQSSALPRHLIALPNEPWAVWRCICLRGAGFPAELMLRLAVPECAAAADRLIHIEAAFAQAQQAALEALKSAYDATSADKRGEVLKLYRRIDKGTVPETPDDDYAPEALAALRSLAATVGAARADFQQSFGVAIDRVSQAIYDVAGSDRFREAVTWQNRHALLTALQPILRTLPGAAARNTQRRKHEELIANYLQRYCVKNETIGFFGPVGLASFVEQGAPIVARPGPSLLATRSVCFEGWCIDAIAKTIARNDALQPWMLPRRMPYLSVDGTTLSLPNHSSLQISVQQAAVLLACAGEQTAQEIAHHLTQIPALGLEHDRAVYDVLEQLKRMQLISWTFDIPLDIHPDTILRRQLEHVNDSRLRTLSLGILDEIVTARDGVARAAGDPEQLDGALERLETTFTQLTDVPATRAAGKTYASRTLVYEDCRRDVDVAIGPDILEALAPPLALLLTSARWFTFEAAAIYRAMFVKLYAELARDLGSSTIPLLDFWSRAEPLIYHEDRAFIQPLLARFHERWSQILALPPGKRQVSYASAELRARVLETFDAPRPGWKFARYHSPDILIAADDVAAISRGEYELVLGELHMGINTLSAGLFLDQHPAPEEVFDALGWDVPEPRLVPITPKDWPGLTTRTRHSFILPKDVRLAFTPDACGTIPSQTVQSGELVVEDTGTGLVVRALDGRWCFDIVEFFAEAISDQMANYFTILRPGRHNPRITIDRLIIHRESWHVAVDTIEFASVKDECERFLAARRWARAHSMPRFVFVKTPLEKKPFYVDFMSPIYINILAKMIRRTLEHGPADALMKFTEMLPTADQTWLPDAEGRRYSCEMRMVMVDVPSRPKEM